MADLVNRTVAILGLLATLVPACGDPGFSAVLHNPCDVEIEFAWQYCDVDAAEPMGPTDDWIVPSRCDTEAVDVNLRVGLVISAPAAAYEELWPEPDAGEERVSTFPVSQCP